MEKIISDKHFAIIRRGAEYTANISKLLTRLVENLEDRTASFNDAKSDLNEASRMLEHVVDSFVDPLEEFEGETYETGS